MNSAQPASGGVTSSIISATLAFFAWLFGFMEAEHIWLQNVAFMVTIIAGLASLVLTVVHSFNDKK